MQVTVKTFLYPIADCFGMPKHEGCRWTTIDKWMDSIRNVYVDREITRFERESC